MFTNTHLANQIAAAKDKSSYDEHSINLLSDFQGNPRYDILNVTFICLGDLKDKDTPNFLSMLSVLLSDRIKPEEKIESLEKNFQIPMTRKLREEIEKMCNLSEAIEERGIEIGSEKTAKENAKKFFENGASYELVRASIEQLSDEVLQEIYNEVLKNKE